LAELRFCVPPNGFIEHIWLRSFEPLGGGSQDQSLGKMVGVAKAFPQLRDHAAKSFDFFKTDNENEPTLCKKRKAWGA